MKRFVFLAIAIFSLGSFAEEKLLREFPAGSYIGEGWYLTSAGQEGRYSSFAEVVGTEWTAAYVTDGRLTTYTAAFDFSNDSFFNVDVTQVDSAGTQSEHLGNGYCIRDTCHLSAFLGHGLLEETVKFVSDSRIERIGSLIYMDQNGDMQTIIWEEKMVEFGGNLDDSDDDDYDDGDDNDEIEE
ncbi:MAG TPA: hypothetical protein VEL47_03970 [Myxococcota bacterium]|nr:hypothetical protein [Myxococcota bacterium]